MSEFLTYTKFHTEAESQAFVAQLTAWGIRHQQVYEKDLLDKIYIGPSLDPMHAVKIPENQFEALNELLLQQEKSHLTNINPDYYLYQFTNEELFEVVQNRNDWNIFDQALAQQLLIQRKVSLPSTTALNLDSEQYTPTHLSSNWIIAQFVLAILIPLIGIFIGLATLYGTKTLKSGEKVPLYDEATRESAKIIFLIGLVVPVLLMLRILRII